MVCTHLQRPILRKDHLLNKGRKWWYVVPVSINCSAPEKNDQFLTKSIVKLCMPQQKIPIGCDGDRNQRRKLQVKQNFMPFCAVWFKNLLYLYIAQRKWVSCAFLYNADIHKQKHCYSFSKNSSIHICTTGYRAKAILYSTGISLLSFFSQIRML